MQFSYRLDCRRFFLNNRRRKIKIQKQLVSFPLFGIYKKKHVLLPNVRLIINNDSHETMYICNVKFSRVCVQKFTNA